MVGLRNTTGSMYDDMGAYLVRLWLQVLHELPASAFQATDGSIMLRGRLLILPLSNPSARLARNEPDFRRNQPVVA